MIAYGPSERPSDAVFSLAANAKGVGLHFLHGSSLPDPQGLLVGSGSQNRFLRIEDLSTLARPEVQDLFNAAEADADPPFLKTGGGKLIIRSISEKQRPRR